MAANSNALLAKAKRANPSLVRSWVTSRAKIAAAKAGLSITRLDEDGRRYFQVTYNDAEPLPAGAEQTLRMDNPDLLELGRAYDAANVPATAHSQWNSGFLKKNLSIAWFRGDNAYVWQIRQARTSARTRMYLQTLDVESRDHLGLMKKLTEDAKFGAWTFEYADRPPISRDLLDSINEINYLDEHMGLTKIEGLRVLDIGAGYGRLAYRMSSAVPNLAAYDCIDGVPMSTFLCDYYLRYREVPDSVRVVRLDEHAKLRDAYDLCVNIHSFSECSIAAIEWWLARIAERDIEWLFIVPNTPTSCSARRSMAAVWTSSPS